MERVLLVYEGDTVEKYDLLIKHIVATYEEKGFTVEEISIENGTRTGLYAQKISKSNAKYVCVLDLAGFQIPTLTGNNLYTITTAKQLHILINEAVLSLYGQDDFALNLFLFVPGKLDKWTKKYPHIPNIEEYEKLERDASDRILLFEKNKQLIEYMIDYVIKETEGI